MKKDDWISYYAYAFIWLVVFGVSEFGLFAYLGVRWPLPALFLAIAALSFIWISKADIEQRVKFYDEQRKRMERNWYNHEPNPSRKLRSASKDKSPRAQAPKPSFLLRILPPFECDDALGDLDELVARWQRMGYSRFRIKTKAAAHLTIIILFAIPRIIKHKANSVRAPK